MRALRANDSATGPTRARRNCVTPRSCCSPAMGASPPHHCWLESFAVDAIANCHSPPCCGHVLAAAQTDASQLRIT